MEQIHETGKILKEIFSDNWKEDFIVDGINDKFFSYSNFFGAILRYKKKFDELSLKNGDIVCIIAPNCVDYLVFYFTSLLMELTIVPIDPNKGEKEIHEILSCINPKCVINESRYNEANFHTVDISFFRKELYINDDVDKNQLDIFNNLDFNKLFLITFTSGTTASPKGVKHSFNNLIKSAISFNKKFNFLN